MTVIKRTKKASATELTSALQEFIYLLEGQKEEEAVADLKKALEDLERNEVESEAFKSAIKVVIDAFGDEHELAVYMMTPKEESPDKWTEKEQLYLASSRVSNLIKRFNK